ncbi:nitrite reductase large subunit NirB [Flexivirga oryzae]|uniref:assimilatory sulfite reductase (ferredoxin) n=1 Tax=Flexivirga oryzae TaxID=1794944 RepID=A0A839NDT2_9MICO|nr:nitrite reductase large subunit NirB [Flexivirga oryzae]MBB2894124.1 nitrite reductase (NADH) large subunit [Flexivirga oryzae]
MTSQSQQHVVVAGAGMVAFRFVEALRARDDGDRFRVTVIGDEPRPPYDRVALTTYFTGRDPEDLHLGGDEIWRDPHVTLRKGTTVVAVDRDTQRVSTDRGEGVDYDHLVLATGSYAARPPVEGRDLRGCFVYRTIDDVAELRGYVETLRSAHSDRPLHGVVVGGGLLGLEAAGALQALGVKSTVVEFAPRLMPLQVDDGGGAVLRSLIEDLGVSVLTDTATSQVLGERRGVVEGMRFADGSSLPADVVVFATGVRPRDELACSAGLSVGERGGVVVDASCVTEDPAISAIGEVACIEGRVWGLVAPGYTMAEVAADRLLGGDASFPGADSSTKLKLLGVDVASFGDAFGSAPGCLEVSYADAVAGVYKKLVLSDDARTLLGGILVGDASSYAALRPMVGQQLRTDPSAYLVPATDGPPPGDDLPDDATVCSCNNVSAGAIRGAVTDQGCCSVAEVKACTRAGTSCGSCLPLVKRLTDGALEDAGISVAKGMCEHFELTRAELFHAVQVTGLRTFSEIIERHGRGRGCDICKPVVASILASLGTGHILGDDRGTLQDTNDHMLANLQKDGTYSVVPRIPGGEVTPDGLIEIGRIAKEFDLYTKITGGQRIDLFGARVEQLPAIWRQLVDAGFESGHAYGKSLRTVKSCVGSSWCRYGVQDSVGMAVLLELRYRGLRSPHKLKLGVSGCARECAEARGKDAGVIATDNGWNLYVGGNGGFTPRHATLLAEDLDDDGLIRAIDRFFIYYIRTADRLQRTAAWLEELPGGIEHLREVVFDDSLGIAAELDAAMERHVASYRDEWSDVLDDPVKLARFTSFVNAAEVPDPDLRYETTRGQRRPVLISGDRLEVRS